MNFLTEEEWLASFLAQKPEQLLDHLVHEMRNMISVSAASVEFIELLLEQEHVDLLQMKQFLNYVRERMKSLTYMGNALLEYKNIRGNS